MARHRDAPPLQRRWSELRFLARFGKGKGNHDDYEFDGYWMSTTFEPAGRTDLEDEVELDIFEDESRQMSNKTLAARFRRAIDDLTVIKTRANEPVLSVRVEDGDGFPEEQPEDSDD